MHCTNFGIRRQGFETTTYFRDEGTCDEAEDELDDDGRGGHDDDGGDGDDGDDDDGDVDVDDGDDAGV